MRLRELATARPRYGYRRLHVLLRREGWAVNLKRILRLYRDEGLLVRTRRRRKMAARPRVPLPAAERVNERWSMDFVSDALASGRRFRALTVLDIFSRECLAIEVGYSISAERVAAVLEGVISERSQPESITVDNGTEFTSKHMDQWAYERGIVLDFIRPGRPMENGYIESFNGKLRDECLSQSWFLNLNDATAGIQAWKVSYNESRPHSSLGNLAPAEYAANLLAWAGN